MNILVTGGAGFIGSHLCERLVKENNVTSLDNYFTGSEKNHIDGVRYIKGDTRNISDIKEVPDIIYHLGEYSRVTTSFEDINLVHQFNIAGTFEVLEYCRKNKVRLIYAGSSTKFGEFENIDTPYVHFKKSNTELVNKYGEWFGLDYAITYFYNVYGDREISTGKYSTLIGIFKEQYKQGKNLTVVLPGTQKRIFTHVDDIVSGLILVGEKGNGDGYCIGADKEYSILEVAKMFKSRIEFINKKRGDRRNSKINTNKTKQLGWKPLKSLEDYINDTIL